MGPTIEFRSSSVASVSFAQWVIEFIECRGETWRESFLRGSWDGIEKQPTRLKANRDHDRTRTVGKIVSFDLPEARGLWGLPDCTDAVG
jgi:hypothetical protein